MRNGYIIDILTSLDLQESFELGVEVMKVYEVVIYKENYK